MHSPEIAAAEIVARCRRLAECTEEPGHITRTFLSPPMREVHRLVRAWMEEAGLSVTLDAVGNLRGVSAPGRAAKAAPSGHLLIGSHLDTVPHAGAFDGVLGVMIAIALAARKPAAPVDVVAFSEEENWFAGSRALIGDPVTTPAVLEAIRAFGLDPARLPEAVLGPDVRAYLEFHIEQGPVLESLGLPLAVVETIAAQRRAEVRFTGAANHAGTTPMHLRRDALAGAAEWVSLAEREGCATPGLVATVGMLHAEPGAANVIAGLARASLDIRHQSDDVLADALDRVRTGAVAVAARRALELEWHTTLEQPAVAMHAEPLERAVLTAGYPVHRMASGAGHDAMILARRVPASLLFLRTPGGISHHPGESVHVEDVEAALAVGERFLDDWSPL